MDDWFTKVLLGLVAAGFFTDITRGFFQRRKVKASASLDEANATQVIVTSTKALLGPLTERLALAEKQVQDLTIKLNEAQGYAEEIVDRLAACNRENARLTRENNRLRKLRPQGGNS